MTAGLQRLTVLGATGSVGRSTLDVVARHPQRLAVHALTAQRDAAGLFELCLRHRPVVAALAEAGAAAELRQRCDAARLPLRVESGSDAIAAIAAAPEADQVMSAIVGAAGLVPTLAAVRAGKRVLIANKEPLVMAGALLLEAARQAGATLIPIDSEHNAIFQCLPAGARCGSAAAGVERLVLTASGGPFRELPLAQLAAVTPAQAVRHPNWNMGPKISVDSATMMNKGLELIEAHHLFAVPPDRIDVVLHPESIVHSLVAYRDGSMLAQLGHPDMRIPIAHALAFPDRWESGVQPLDLAALARLRFAPLEPARYPCLGLARDAMVRGDIYPIVLNAANEIAVEAFLGERIGFGRIAGLIESTLAAAAGAALPAPGSLDAVLGVDAWARAAARAALASPARRAGAGA